VPVGWAAGPAIEFRRPACIVAAMAAPRPQIARSPLEAPVTALWGVGNDRAAQLARLGIHTIEDLLLHRPRRYEDRRRFCPISQLTTEAAALARGTVVALGLKRFRRGAKSVFELILDDGSGRLHCRWWNLPFMENYFAVGDEVVVFGKLSGLKPRTMDHPESEVVEGDAERFVHVDRLTPIYPLTEGLSQRWLRGLIWRTLERFAGQIPEPWPPGQPAAPGLPTRPQAVRWLHFPGEQAEAELARRRLALDEFVALQVRLQARRRRFERHAQALPCGGEQNRLIKPFLARLGFQLTEAQTRVLREIRADLAASPPMRRLLQGDVGSGKTVVAACAALMALESGYSVALMAPTEVLAEQHHLTFRRWFEPLGVRVELRTGSRKTAGVDATTLPLANGAKLPALIIGTHALLTERFDIPRLGLVIIDEQHKFGVAQREALVRKGRYPHLLVMTATPIPRTLGLTLYGDLDLSVIDTLPGGRGRLQTFVRTPASLPRVWAFVRQQLAAGRQAYVVYPRVEETDAGAVKAVMRERDAVQAAVAPFRVGLLHGRLAARHKEAVMAAFRANSVQVLLATSLVEVGLDVPNATVMLIENAEQFGLSQLHQLRGRIGRGAADAYCILVAGSLTPEARARLQVLAETQDGFRIAEADLRLRGPGELLGRAQSGLPRFRFGDLAEDLDLIQQARALATQIVAADMPAPRPSGPASEWSNKSG